MLWLLALLPIAAAAAVFGVGPQRRGVLAAMAIVALAASAACLVFGAANGWAGSVRWSAAMRLGAELTPLSTLVSALVFAVALPVVAYAALHESRTGLPRLVALLLVFVGAMQLLLVAADWLTLLIGWEVVGACSWALIGHRWRDAANGRAGVYAFVTTRLGDLGLFIAAFAAYAGTGSFEFAALARLDGPLLAVVGFGVLVSAASKSGQLPFSPWLFRAMSGPAPVSALLHAATMVAAGAYLLARLHPLLAHAGALWFAAMGVGIVTALSGGVVALLQTDVKKVLAASTSAHFGLMFVAVGAGFAGVAVLHLVAHGLFKALLFLAAGLAADRAGSHDLNAIHAAGLGRVMPLVALMAAVGSAALAGIPPLGAGWTKEAIVGAAGAVAAGWGFAVVIAGGLSAAYAARWLWLAYVSRADDAGRAPPPPAVLTTFAALAIGCLALAVLWLPGVDAWLATALKIGLPEASAAVAGLSLTTVLLGVLGGRLLALRYPRLGQAGKAAAVADWWGLPTLIDRGVVRPVSRLAVGLARFDDAVIDALPRAAGAAGRRGAAGIGRADTRVVDAGVVLATSFVQWLAKAGSRVGEPVADGIAIVPARLAAISADDARRLQTGLSHHAFTFLLLGALALLALLLAAAS